MKLHLSLVFFVLMNAFDYAQSGKPALHSRATRGGSSDGLVAAIYSARPTVVQVIMRCSTNAGPYVSTGTGFFAGPTGVVVTARHVVTPPQGAKDIDVAVNWPVDTSSVRNGVATGIFTDQPAVVTAEDPAHDIAILTPQFRGYPPNVNALSPEVGRHTGIVIGVPLPARKRAAARLEVRHLKDGEPIFIPGYPLDFPTLITTSGHIASSEPISMDYSTGRALDVYWGDIQANHGNSGGPVFSLTSGAVIGMQVAVKTTGVEIGNPPEPNAFGFKDPRSGDQTHYPISYNSGIAYIVPSSYIVALMNANNIPWTGVP